MNIYLNDENYKHEIFELTRNVFGNKKIEFVEKNYRGDFIAITINKDLSVSYIKEDKILYSSEFKNYKDNINDYIGDKALIKREVFKLYKSQFSKVSSWGVLTGIRPVKVAKRYLKEHSAEETLFYLKNEMLLEEEKSKLITDIAVSQEKYIENLVNQSYSIYINIPFCPTRCSYCSFSTIRIDKHKDLVEKYLKVLKREIKEILQVLEGNKLNTVYIGGGTPSSLNCEQLEDLLIFINSNINKTPILEFTVEAGREDTLSLEKLKVLKENGVNRISLNPQSFNEKTLKLIDRKQNNAELIKRYYEAKKIGFNSINMDIILGLPKENIDDLNITLKAIGELQPDNLTVHTLSVKKGSKINDNSLNLEIEQKNIENMMNMTKKFTEQNGYKPYYMYRQKQILGNMENIGFSKIGKECIYNITMMEEEENIIGLGMGSSTKIIKNDGEIASKRNYKNMRDYINNIEEVIKDKKIMIGEVYDKRI